jgi:hypothetical protein
MMSSHAIAIWLFERLAVDVALTGTSWKNAHKGIRRSGIGGRC